MKKNSCLFNGSEYSNGATICSNNKELVCNDGNWEPTGKDCDNEVKSVSEVLILNAPVETEKMEMFNGCAAGWATSESYTINNGYGNPPTSSVPKITVTQSQITISHTQDGGGSFTVTILSGSGGNYTFTPGTYNITPGVYSHQTDGHIYGLGSIHSYVCYK